MSGSILVIDGHFQPLGGWLMAQTLRAAGFDVAERTQSHDNGGDPDHVTPADCQGRDTIMCYSHGGLSLKENTDNFKTLKCRRVIGVMAVQSPQGLWAADWDFPESVEQVIMFQLTPDIACPVSEPVQQIDGNKPELWYDWGDNNALPAILAADAQDNFANRRININLKPLVPWWRRWLGISNHTTYENDPALHAFIVRIMALSPPTPPLIPETP